MATANNTTAITIKAGLSTEVLVVAYHSLIITVAGTLLNFLTFIILCRSTFRDTRARPTLHYMRTIAIFDILMLYGWNIDHYVSFIHGFTFQGSSIAACKFLSFLNYFAAQSSAWLRVFVCFDRYLSLSRLHRTWFSKSNHVLLIIGLIMVVLFLLNLHFFIFVCYYDARGRLNYNSWLYRIYPIWDFVNLGVYNCAPFVFMSILNSGVIYHLIRVRRTSTVQNSRIQHRAISITLVITTFLFLLMTVPATVAFAFFSDANKTTLRALDGVLYTYHILSFPLYFITFEEFRRECIGLITCKKVVARVGPVSMTLTKTQTKQTTQNGTWMVEFSSAFHLPSVRNYPRTNILASDCCTLMLYVVFSISLFSFDQRAFWQSPVNQARLYCISMLNLKSCEISVLQLVETVRTNSRFQTAKMHCSVKYTCRATSRREEMTLTCVRPGYSVTMWMQRKDWTFWLSISVNYAVLTKARRSYYDQCQWTAETAYHQRVEFNLSASTLQVTK